MKQSYYAKSSKNFNAGWIKVWPASPTAPYFAKAQRATKGILLKSSLWLRPYDCVLRSFNEGGSLLLR